MTREELEKEATESSKKAFCIAHTHEDELIYTNGFQQGSETTLRKVVKYFSTRVLDENCGGYFSHLLENEEKLQELAKKLENV